MRKESEPMQITDFMLKSPCKVICASYFLLLVFAVLTLILGYMVPVLEESGGREFAVWKAPLQVNLDLLTLADQYVQDTKGDPVVALQT